MAIITTTPAETANPIKRIFIGGLQGSSITAADLQGRFEGGGFGKVLGVDMASSFAHMSVQTTPKAWRKFQSIYDAAKWKNATLKIEEAKPHWSVRAAQERKENAEAVAREAAAAAVQESKKTLSRKKRKAKMVVESETIDQPMSDEGDVVPKGWRRMRNGRLVVALQYRDPVTRKIRAIDVTRLPGHMKGRSLKSDFPPGPEPASDSALTWSLPLSPPPETRPRERIVNQTAVKVSPDIVDPENFDFTPYTFRPSAISTSRDTISLDLSNSGNAKRRRLEVSNVSVDPIDVELAQERNRLLAIMRKVSSAESTAYPASAASKKSTKKSDTPARTESFIRVEDAVDFMHEGDGNDSDLFEDLPVRRVYHSDSESEEEVIRSAKESSSSSKGNTSHASNSGKSGNDKNEDGNSSSSESVSSSSSAGEGSSCGSSSSSSSGGGSDDSDDDDERKATGSNRPSDAMSDDDEEEEESDDEGESDEEKEVRHGKMTRDSDADSLTDHQMKDDESSSDEDSDSSSSAASVMSKGENPIAKTVESSEGKVAVKVNANLRSLVFGDDGKGTSSFSLFSDSIAAAPEPNEIAAMDVDPTSAQPSQELPPPAPLQDENDPEFQASLKSSTLFFSHFARPDLRAQTLFAANNGNGVDGVFARQAQHTLEDVQQNWEAVKKGLTDDYKHKHKDALKRARRLRKSGGKS